MNNKFISWRRVSTFKQNKTGLGLSAQKEIIRYFIERDGGVWLADYEECYTGTELSGCTELHKAMEHAKREKAILIIAKSDRFRNTAEALKIYEEMGDGNIMFCDLPTSDKFSLTLFFALAEREALLVSIRTKQALAAKKARGEKLGGAADKWAESYKNKTREEIKEIGKKRGFTKCDRYLSSRDVQAFLRVLKNVFPDACVEENIGDWDWSSIGTKGDSKQRMAALIKDYRDFDENGVLFKKWDIENWDDLKIQVRLSSQIKNIKRSIKLKNKNQ